MERQLAAVQLGQCDYKTTIHTHTYTDRQADTHTYKHAQIQIHTLACVRAHTIITQEPRSMGNNADKKIMTKYSILRHFNLIT